MPVWLRSRGLERRSVRHGELSWRAEAMLESLDLGDAELSILLCDDATIRRLNRRYRRRTRRRTCSPSRCRRAPARPRTPVCLGDVVISLPTATRQAAEHDRPIIAEVTFLLAHGLLHLLGYDHATKREEREMSARTERFVGRRGGRPVGLGLVENPCRAPEIRASKSSGCVCRSAGKHLKPCDSLETAAMPVMKAASSDLWMVCG